MSDSRQSAPAHAPGYDPEPERQCHGNSGACTPSATPRCRCNMRGPWSAMSGKIAAKQASNTGTRNQRGENLSPSATSATEMTTSPADPSG